MRSHQDRFHRPGQQHLRRLLGIVDRDHQLRAQPAQPQQVQHSWHVRGDTDGAEGDRHVSLVHLPQRQRGISKEHPRVGQVPARGQTQHSLTQKPTVAGGADDYRILQVLSTGVDFSPHIGAQCMCYLAAPTAPIDVVDRPGPRGQRLVDREKPWLGRLLTTNTRAPGCRLSPRVTQT